MRAIIGALQEHVEREEARLRREREEYWRRLKAEERGQVGAAILNISDRRILCRTDDGPRPWSIVREAKG